MFRIWLKDRKKMVYPNDTLMDDNGVPIILYINLDGEVTAFSDSDDMREVDIGKAIVMEYIGQAGVQDVKRVYVGDIVEAFYESGNRLYTVNGYISYDNNNAKYVLKVIKGYKCDYIGIDKVRIIKVVGNIFENIDLI